jgi:hypothetical protein
MAGPTLQGGIQRQCAWELTHEFSVDAAWIGLYYVVEPGLVPNKLTNLRAGRAEVNRLDFIHEWDIQR